MGWVLRAFDRETDELRSELVLAELEPEGGSIAVGHTDEALWFLDYDADPVTLIDDVAGTPV